MRVAQEEMFGPELVVIPFKTEEEAIRIANDFVRTGRSGVDQRPEARSPRGGAGQLGTVVGQLLVRSRLASAVWRGKSKRYRP